ncbi:transposable element Tcb2 transposase [Trichonephila clavipes]|nr:transposable element Tcb2 transposase [Trichonephila clavipes]
MQVLNRSRQNDRLRVMLVLVHIDITLPHTPLPVFRRIGERTIPYSWRASTRGLLATDHVILNHGQVTWTTPELAPPLLTTTPHQRVKVRETPTDWQLFLGGVGSSESERCHLHEEQAQDALDRPVVEKTATSISASITWAALDAQSSTPPFGGKWTAAEWNQVVFSDEYRFNISSDDNRVRMWRSRVKRLNPVFALQRHTAPTAGSIFQQANARPHTALLDCLRTITTLPWPARTPDLFPIKHIWDHLGRRAGHPTSLNEHEAMLQQIWNEMSQDLIQNLYASMPDRIALCILARGGSTGY